MIIGSGWPHILGGCYSTQVRLVFDHVKITPLEEAFIGQNLDEIFSSRGASSTWIITVRQVNGKTESHNLR